VLGGGVYVSPVLAERLALDWIEDAGWPVHETLPNWEFEVLRMIALGRIVTQIAEEMHLSVSTTSTHRAHILEKINMTTTVEFVHYAVRNHLVD